MLHGSGVGWFIRVRYHTDRGRSIRVGESINNPYAMTWLEVRAIVGDIRTLPTEANLRWAAGLASLTINQNQAHEIKNY